MQLAKVVITSALVYAVCTEGLPEGKSCVLKYVKIFYILYHGRYLRLPTVVCLLCAMDKSFSSSSRQKVSVENICTYCHTLPRIHITGGQLIVSVFDTLFVLGIYY